MWQRVQTLYLAISTLLVASMFFCEKAEGIRFTAYWPYVVLLVIISLLDLLALTSYKFRVFQVRTAVLAALLTSAFQIWLAVDFIATGNDPIFRIAAVFPAVSVVFDALAARGIWADELMVRSSSRLRSSGRSGKRPSSSQL